MEKTTSMSLEQFNSLHGEKLKIIGRWHDIVRFRGVVICEVDDPDALNHWALEWIDLLDYDIAPVVEDDEMMETVNRFLASQD